MERFDSYMERCLYGPDGFYTIHGVAGRARGDFITSPEVGPLFGAVLANALDAWWDAAGRPDRWTVYDVGCGPNTLLKAIRKARPADRRPWRLIGVDRARRNADSSGETPPADSAAGAVEWCSELPEDLTGAIILGNELLDNLPFRIIEHGTDGQWREVFVEAGVERLMPTDARLDIPPGVRAPLLSAATRWCRSIMERQASRLCLFDYGATTAELAERGGWLRTYRKHQRGGDPLAEPGRWDITVDVAVDQLPPGAAIETQVDFLRRWGIDTLVEEGRDHWRAHAARPDLQAMAMRSRVSEAEALTDPNGLGSWLVIQYASS